MIDFKPEKWRVSSDGYNVSITTSPPGIWEGSKEIAEFHVGSATDRENLAKFIVEACQLFKRV